MPTIKGNLMFVSSRAAQVSEVWVRAPRVRTHVEGVVTTGNDRFPVDGGEVSFTAVPGPAVLALISQGRAVDTIPILVGDASTQTLRQVVSAAKVADDATKREIEKLAAQAVQLVDSSVTNAKKAQDGATRAAKSASTADASADRADESANISATYYAKAEKSAGDAAKSAQTAASKVSEAATHARYASASAGNAEKSATKAKQDADRAANIASSTSWNGDKLTVNGKTSPSLTGPTGPRGLKGDSGASTWADVTGKPVAVGREGDLPVANGDYSTALGMGAKAENYSTAIGSAAGAAGEASTALGMGANSTGEYSTALGASAQSAKGFSLAIGAAANAGGENSVALGANSHSMGDRSVAIGYEVSESRNDTVTIGKSGQTVIIAGKDLVAELATLEARVELLERK